MSLTLAVKSSFSQSQHLDIALWSAYEILIDKV